MSESISQEARLLEVLARYWGYDSFRPLQREAMESVLAGRDSVVVLPTGGGKSLCFQAPALCLPGLAVVVSPLISLMKDQVDALQACGVPAAYVNSSQSADEQREVARRIRDGTVRLLYVAPERLLGGRMIPFLHAVGVSIFAIDEAHCISNWGHDFRPEYRGLRLLRDAFPQAGVHAYTATASERVRQDVAEQLNLRTPHFLVGSFDRPNLTYRVRRRSQALQQIRQIADRHPGESGIVYCISRAEVDRTAAALSALGYRTVPYHAGLTDEERKHNQEAFIQSRVEIVVATVAFGMGIDKSNVRFVVHAGMPKSIEHYQQESGRAGRDGLEAECCLLYSGRDVVTWKKLMETGGSSGAGEALEAMASFCTSLDCRHQALVRYFGQSLPGGSCGACDICLNEVELIPESLILAQKILSNVVRLKERFGADYNAQVLIGEEEQRILRFQHHQLSTYGLLSAESKTQVVDWIGQLIGQGYLVRDGEYQTLRVTDDGRRVLRGEVTPRLARSTAAAGGRNRGTVAIDSWEGVDTGLFEALRTLRQELAAARGVPAYIILADSTLRELARHRPTNIGGLRGIKGIGEKKSEEFGDLLLARIADYCQAHDLSTDEKLAVTPSGDRPTPAPSEPSSSALVAFPLFRAGKSVPDVAQQLARAESTTHGYLAQYLRFDKVTDPSPWVPAAHWARVCRAIQEVGHERLKPIHEQLGGEISYEEIRVCVTCWLNERDQKSNDAPRAPR